LLPFSPVGGFGMASQKLDNTWPSRPCRNPDTAKELFAISGEHVVATAEGNSAKENPPPASRQSGKQAYLNP
jgi:hypothetical protein